METKTTKVLQLLPVNKFCIRVDMGRKNGVSFTRDNKYDHEQVTASYFKIPAMA